MGVDLPDLDDRGYDDLRAEAEALLSAHAEEWSDHAAHDPGITVLELLAWLTETYGYQLDRITEDHREKFLGLLGERPRPPEPASAVLSVTPPSDSVVMLPEGTPLRASENGEQYRFETVHDLAATGARVERVVVAGSAGRIDVTQENHRENGSFRAFGDDPAVGDALYLGFETDPFAAAETLTLWVDCHDSHLPEPATGRFEPSVEPVWERFRPASDGWQPVDIRHDGTDAWYRSGRVTLGRTGASQRPDSSSGTPPGEGDLTWLRCRVATPGYEFPPELSAVRADCVRARHGRTVDSETLQQAHDPGTPRGLNDQTYAFEHAPVQEATVTVDDCQWEPAADFDAVGPDDRVYTIDRDSGTITFGDGLRGSVPEPDATVKATYTAGGGADANLSGRSTWRFVSDDSTAGHRPETAVTAVGEATGGRDGESVTAALERARREQRRHYRAVTREDYSEIVSRTPGTRVARSTVCIEDSGATVVVVPYAPSDVRRPQPSDGLRTAVREHLGERALLGERVTVRGPRYVTLDIDVTARTQSDAAGTAIERAVSRLVHPVAGDGWPFGQSLRPAAVAEVVEDCDAVHRVTDVTVTPRRPTMGVGEAVPLDDQSLFAVGDVTLTARQGASDL